MTTARITLYHDDDPNDVADKFRRALVGFCIDVVDVTALDEDVTVTYEIRVDPVLTKAAQDKAFAEYEAKDEQRRKLAREAAAARGLTVDAPPSIGQEWNSFSLDRDSGAWIFYVESVESDGVHGYWNRSDDYCSCPFDVIDQWPPIDPSGNAMVLVKT